tara:strand:+ start:9980 stop:10570 length:591 start_codon:yes stop_codon:yes gene_type:complete
MSAAASMKRDDPPGFSIGPLGTYADPQEMRDWLAGAAVGDTITYATTPALGEQDAAKLARAWAAQGHVELFQRRAPRAHCFDYCARRNAGVPVAAQARGGEAERDAADTRSQMRALLQVLRRCAARGAACPSNASLAVEIGLNRGPRGRRRAQYLFDRLVSEKRIAVRSGGRNAPRVVTVLAAGKGCGQSTLGEAR